MFLGIDKAVRITLRIANIHTFLCTYVLRHGQSRVKVHMQLDMMSVVLVRSWENQDIVQLFWIFTIRPYAHLVVSQCGQHYLLNMI